MEKFHELHQFQEYILGTLGFVSFDYLRFGLLHFSLQYNCFPYNNIEVCQVSVSVDKYKKERREHFLQNKGTFVYPIEENDSLLL